MDNLRVLTVTALCETSEANSRLTMSPMEIEMCNAHDSTRQGLPAKRVEVLFKSGSGVAVWLSEYDLILVEQAIGTYCLD